MNHSGHSGGDGSFRLRDADMFTVDHAMPIPGRQPFHRRKA